MGVSAALNYRSYRWRGVDEWLAEVGEGPTILLVPPLFEELNRCRALLAGVMRGLAAASLRAVLPDLPGAGESPRSLDAVRWDDWTGAMGMLSFDIKARVQMPFVASFRGGCLIDDQVEASGRWRFAPVAGAALARDLIRARQASLPGKARAEAIEAEVRTSAVEFAGYEIPPEIFGPMCDAAIPDTDGARVVRLASDPAAADLKLDGKPLWRQAEPGNDLALSAALASDIAEWVRKCAA